MSSLRSAQLASRSLRQSARPVSFAAALPRLPSSSLTSRTFVSSSSPSPAATATVTSPSATASSSSSSSSESEFYNIRAHHLDVSDAPELKTLLTPAIQKVLDAEKDFAAKARILAPEDRKAAYRSRLASTPGLEQYLITRIRIQTERQKKLDDDDLRRMYFVVWTATVLVWKVANYF